MKNNNVLLIAILSLIFAACEKDNILENKEVSGKEAVVRIRSMSVVEGGSESFTRSSLQKKPEMATTPVGDGMLLEMSIKEDETPLRATVQLANGTHFRVIAVTGTSNYYSHGDYIYGSGTLTPTNDFHVRIDQTYSFICISYNSTTLPPTTGYTVGSALPSLSVDNTKDLLWWHSTSATKILASGIDLEIVLKQRLAKVKVKLDCDYNKWKIGVGTDKVSIKDVALSGTMNLSTGDVTGGTAGTQLLPSFSTTVNATSQTSNELKIMPKASSTITVTILTSAVSRDASTAIPTADKTATLTTALIAGTSYTITVRLRTPIWARSNIYWDATAQKMTFVPAAIPPDTNDDTKQGYQGVFFRLGSLVGISPAKTGGSNSFLNQDVPVYVPNVASSTWEATTSTAKNWTTWGDNTNAATDIPYMDPDRGNGIVGRDNTWLIDEERNVPDTLNGFRGDICQYLTSKTHAVTGDYRLPTSYEFGADGDWARNGTFATNTTLENNLSAAGTTIIIKGSSPYNRGYATNNSMDVVFPASGYRSRANGTLYDVGTISFHSSGSAYSAADSYFMSFNTNFVSSSYSGRRGYGMPVRCVKK